MYVPRILLIVVKFYIKKNMCISFETEQIYITYSICRNIYLKKKKNWKLSILMDEMNV